MKPIPPKPFTFIRFLVYVFILLVLAFTYWSAMEVEFSLSRLVEGLPHMQDFLRRSWPPDLSIAHKVLQETLLTVQLAWISTVIAALISIPVSLLAAANITKNIFVRKIVLVILNSDRAVDSLILALFFVSAVGLGPFPGTLALSIHSVGMLAKLFADAIESVDKGPIEALQSAGAGKLAVIRWAIWPQVIPQFISLFLFRFELNVKAAVILGLVGAGGIGFLLQQYMRLFQYQQAAMVVLVILGLVMIVDFFSSILRRSVL